MLLLQILIGIVLSLVTVAGGTGVICLLCVVIEFIEREMMNKRGN